MRVERSESIRANPRGRRPTSSRSPAPASQPPTPPHAAPCQCCRYRWTSCYMFGQSAGAAPFHPASVLIATFTPPPSRHHLHTTTFTPPPSRHHHHQTILCLVHSPNHRHPQRSAAVAEVGSISCARCVRNIAALPPPPRPLRPQ